MQFTVLPAGSQTGMATIDFLLKGDHGHTVVGVYRNVSKAPAKYTSHPNFKAIQGDMDNGSSLDFTGSDAVLTLAPPRFDSEDIAKVSKSTSENIKAAIERSGTVKRLIFVSSLGAEVPTGTVSAKALTLLRRAFVSRAHASNIGRDCAELCS